MGSGQPPPPPLYHDDDAPAPESRLWLVWLAVFPAVVVWRLLVRPLVQTAIDEHWLAWAGTVGYVGGLALLPALVPDLPGRRYGWRSAVSLLALGIAAGMLGELLVHRPALLLQPPGVLARAPGLAQGLLRSGSMWVWCATYAMVLVAGVLFARWRRARSVAAMAAAAALLALASVAAFGGWTQQRIRAAEAHVTQGSALRMQGSYQAAAREFEEAVRLRPRASDIRYRLADIYQGDLRDDAAAARHYERLVALDRDLATMPVKDAYRWLGGWYAREGRLGEAVVAYRRYAEREPRLEPWARSSAWSAAPQPWVPADQLLGLVDGMGLRGADKEMVAACTAVLEFDPGHAEAKAWLGLGTARLGETEKGLALCEEAVAAAPRSQETHLGLGWVLLLVDRPADAVEAMKKATSLQGGLDIQTQKAFADALHEAGRCEEAVAAYEAADGRGAYGPAMHGLATCLRESGRLREAVEVYEQLVELLPDYKQGRRELEEARAELAASR